MSDQKSDTALDQDVAALKLFKEEIAVRAERKRQSTPGIDADGHRVSRDTGLLAFIRYFWDVLEPEAKFVEGWVLDDMARHLEAVTLGKITHLMINVSPGSMKPVSVDELVLTKRGRLRLGDVLVGDEVLTHRGRFRRVSAVHEQGKLPLLSIRTSSGRSLKTEKTHPLLTTRGWIQAQDLKIGDMLGAVVPQEDPYGAPMTAEEARLLGYLVGDGGLSHHPTFTNSDDEVISDFVYCANTLGISTARRSRYARWVAGSPDTKVVSLRGARSLLSKHGLLGKNSYTKRIPPLVLASNKEVIANFVGAYWSCDGMIKIRHKRKRGDLHLASCTTVGFDLAKDIQHALLRLGIHAKLRRCERRLESKKQPGGTYSSYQVNSATHDNAVKFRDMPGLCSRKNAPLKELTPQRFQQGPLFEDEIVAIDWSPPDNCRCLTVEEDHSFTASDLAVKNSLLTNVFFPAWEWGPMKMPHLRYVSFAYSSGLTERDNIKFRKLVQSEKYRKLWGDVFELEKEGEIKITNDKTGSKFASSVTGIGLGERGDRVILDDPHDVKRAESDVVRNSTLEWFRGTITDRLNNPERSAIIIIMQRVHMRDICGMILDENWDYCHMMVPEEFEPGRVPNNSLGWVDPRTEDGELAWPERRSAAFVDRAKKEKGSFHFAGQYLQRPAPRSGGIIKFEHWQPYNVETAAARFGMRYPQYPVMTFSVLAVDTAQTEKKTNDPSAAVLLGVCQDIVNLKNQVMLMYAWADRLEFYELCSKVEDICKRYRVDKVIIEDKASGLPLASELRRRSRVFQDKLAHGKEKYRSHANFTVQTVRPEGDKVARAYSVQGLFEAGVVWAPCDENGTFKYWADLVMKEAAELPKGAHDDLVDSLVYGLKFLREIGIALMPDDFQFEEEDAMQYKRPEKPMYPFLGGG